jgi:hypothetical protein
MAAAGITGVGSARLSDGFGSLSDVVGEASSSSVMSAIGSWERRDVDLAVLLDHERTAPDQGLTLALLDLRSGDGPLPVRAAADRVLRHVAPWVLDVDSALQALRPTKVDDRSWALFCSWSSWRAPRSLQQLGAEAGLSGQRTGKITHRVDARLRAGLSAAPASLRWLVGSLGRRLGPVATVGHLEATLARLGVEGSASELLVWLAGPYRPVPARTGWLAIDPATIVARSAACLSADGGVRRLADVEAELGLDPELGGSWLRACGATVIHDLAVLVTGPLAGVVERILDAHGRTLAAPAIASAISDGGRTPAAPALHRALRAPRFRRSPAGELGLRDWGDEVFTEPVPGPGGASQRLKPAPLESRPEAEAAVAEARLPVDGGHESTADGRLWLWVRVDGDVLRGLDAVVPTGLMEGLGVGVGQRRAFTSRYGPIVLAYDGPQPIRGAIRAVTLAAGCYEGDTLLLGFSEAGDVVVEFRRTVGYGTAPVPTGAALTFPPLTNGGMP